MPPYMDSSFKRQVSSTPSRSPGLIAKTLRVSSDTVSRLCPHVGGGTRSSLWISSLSTRATSGWRRSGLFGLLGDEHIQLVDPLDTKRLKDYFRFLVKARRRQANSDVGRLLEACWKQRYKPIPEWREEARTREVWRAWLAAHAGGFKGITDPRDIWDGPREWDNHELDMLDLASFALSQGTGIDMQRFRPNQQHPWVQDVLAGLPSFRPQLMIWHCSDETCLVPPVW